MERPYEYRPVRFFVLTIVVTWIPWFLGVYAQSQPGMESAVYQMPGSSR